MRTQHAYPLAIYRGSHGDYFVAAVPTQVPTEGDWSIQVLTPGSGWQFTNAPMHDDPTSEQALHSWVPHPLTPDPIVSVTE